MNVNVRDSSTWRFLAGGATDTGTDGSDSAEAVAVNGYNGVYYSAFLNSNWDDITQGATVTNGMTQQQWWQSYCQELHKRGCLFENQAYAWEYWGYPSNGLLLQAVVLNANGMGDSYISQYAKMVGVVQPDICQIYNEPYGLNSDGSPQGFTIAQYVTFCNRLMAAIAAVKSPMTFVVMGVPHWNPFTIIGQSFVVPAGCTLITSQHLYGDFDDFLGGSGCGDVSGIPFCVAYYNSGQPLSSSQRAAAQALLEQYYFVNGSIYNVAGIQAAGWQVFIEESGECLLCNNVSEFIADFYALCNKYNVGFNLLCSVIAGTDCGASTPIPLRKPGGIFNADWSLNAIGQAAAPYVSGEKYSLTIKTGVV